jgi:NAD(P)-dependent dehydrogenase (short-subunit alcohol dehydrogenase family)
LGYYSRRVAVVTGAGSGIGRAVALALARDGASLALADTDADAVAATARQCQVGGVRVHADTLDVADRQAVLDYASAVRDGFGGADLVFAAAGVIHTGSLLASSFSDLDHVINVNVFGLMNTAKAFLPALISSGRGHIVAFSSGFGLVGAPHYSAYCMTKFAIRGFAESLRQEMAADCHPVTVTCVVPGRIRTAIMRHGSYADGENAAAITARFAEMARMDADEAAAVILRGVARNMPQVLVGRDARAVAWLARAVGSRYQDLQPLLSQFARRAR